MIRKSVKRFSCDKREAFARGSCSNNKLNRDDNSSQSHRALGQGEALAPRFLADGGDRIARLARDAGKLFVGDLEATSYDPDLHVVAQVQIIAGSAKLLAARDHVALPCRRRPRQDGRYTAMP